MRIAFMLLHDQRFSGWTLQEFLYSRYHFAKEYARRMSMLGHEVTLFVMYEGLLRVEDYHVQGYSVRALPVSFRFPPFVSIGASHNAGIFGELRGDFDVVHFHNYYLWSLVPVALARKGSSWKLVGQYHGEPELQSLGKLVHSPWLQFPDKLLVSTSKEEMWLSRLGVSARKIVRVPNVGVDVGCFRKVADYERTPLFVYVGRMTSRPRTMNEKNPWLVVEIADQLKNYLGNFRILMVGDGPGLLDLKTFCKARGLDEHVSFLGHVPHERLPEIYSKCWYSFVPVSMQTIDPFWDGALKESLACETPVIGFSNAVKDATEALSRFGLLLPPKPELAAKILGSCAGTAENWVKIGVGGREFVKKHCSWDSVAASLLGVYNSFF
ncbi:glycosyltransferase family 4 protein [Candidatus Bathyarchaeota archaeon]|nr:glycosyltransferase family 4 protein [Candidatus Bathyarchaeota archaeon]